MEPLTARQQVVYGLLTLFVAILLSSGFAIWYSARVSEQAERNAAVYTDRQNQVWCSALAVFTRNDPRKLPPPTTPAAREQRPQQIEAYDTLVGLRRGFHCDK